MKRPLYVFSIYLIVYMGLMALFRPVVDEVNIERTAIAQAEAVQTAGSD